MVEFSYYSHAGRGSIPYQTWRAGSISLTRNGLRTDRRRAYWSVAWRWRGEYHTAFLRPRIEWCHINRTQQSRLDEMGG